MGESSAYTTACGWSNEPGTSIWPLFKNSIRLAGNVEPQESMYKN